MKQDLPGDMGDEPLKKQILRKKIILIQLQRATGDTMKLLRTRRFCFCEFTPLHMNRFLSLMSGC